MAKEPWQTTRFFLQLRDTTRLNSEGYPGIAGSTIRGRRSEQMHVTALVFDGHDIGERHEGPPAGLDPFDEKVWPNKMC